MLWSQTTIPGEPRLVLVDGSRNVGGWEAEFTRRISSVLARKGLHLSGAGPLPAAGPEDLAKHLPEQDSSNCMLLVCHSDPAQVGPGSTLAGYWSWLSQRQGLAPKLLAICTFDSHDPAASEAILQARDSFASLAIVPQSPLTPRVAGLFYIKFFTELCLHSTDALTGRMVWFSCSKARELLKRRRLAGQIGMRC